MKTIQIYGRKQCPWCDAAKSVVKTLKVPFEYIDIQADEKAFQLLETKVPGFKTVPQILVGDERIGGYEDLVHAISSGRIKELIGA